MYLWPRPVIIPRGWTKAASPALEVLTRVCTWEGKLDLFFSNAMPFGFPLLISYTYTSQYPITIVIVMMIKYHYLLYIFIYSNCFIRQKTAYSSAFPHHFRQGAGGAFGNDSVGHRRQLISWTTCGHFTLAQLLYVCHVYQKLKSLAQTWPYYYVL